MVTRQRAAIYARYSSDAQRDVSIEDQVDACREYCAREGYKVVAEYHDRAMTGRNDARPNFRRMVKEMAKFDLVVIWNTDRLHRNMFNAFRYLGDLIAAGRDIRSVTQPELNDSTSDTRMLLFGIYAWKDQRYSEDLSKNVTRGMRKKAENCLYLGYSTYGYSHDGDTITVDESQAEMVRYAFRRYIAGDSISTVQRRLKEAGALTRYGNPPTFAFVREMLKNEKYRGVYVWNDVRVEGGMPRIIDDATWAMAMERSRRQARKAPNNDYMLVGRLVCGICGGYMHGEQAKNGEYRYYCCSGQRRACRGSTPVAYVDDAVSSVVRGIFSDYETCERLVGRFLAWQEGESGQTDVSTYRKQLREISKRRSNLVDAISKGLPMDAAAPTLKQLQEEEDALNIRIADAEQELVTSDELYEFLDYARSGGFSGEDLVDAFVHEVVIYEDRLVVITRIKGMDTELMEIEKALDKEILPTDGAESTCDIGMVGQVCGYAYKIVLMPKAIAAVVTIDAA